MKLLLSCSGGLAVPLDKLRMSGLNLNFGDGGGTKVKFCGFFGTAVVCCTTIPLRVWLPATLQHSTTATAIARVAVQVTDIVVATCDRASRSWSARKR